MDWKDFVHWGFEGIITFVALYASNILSKLSDSVDALNRSVAMLLERSTNQEKRSDGLDRRIDRLEKK